MPSDFETQMIADMTQCFTGRDEFDEEVTYVTSAGASTSGVRVVYQEYIGAIDEKTQAVFIVPVASVATPDRGDVIVRASGERWQIIDVSQRDAAASNCRGVLPQAVT